MTTETTEPATARHAFTVDDFHRMAEAGILTEDDRVELIDGEVLEMTPIGPQHGGAVNILTAAFAGLTPRTAVLAVQNPLVLADHSEPQPDLMLLRPRDDYYARAHPRPQDVLLLVEVADESRRHDREIKLPRYAAGGVPETWIVDLAAKRVEGHREPARDGYARTTTHAIGESIAPAAFPDAEIAVEKLFPGTDA